MKTREAAALAAAFVCVLAGSACRDSSGPARRVLVTLEAAVIEGPTIGLSGTGSTTVECLVALSAVATGVGSALWEDGTLLFYAGRDRSVAADSVAVSPLTLADIWSASRIESGETQESEIGITADIPFAATLRLRYRQATGDAAPRTTEASFTCGPTVPANSGPPTISSLTVHPGSLAVEPGQSITVGYTAESAIGLVETEVVVSGACEFRARSAEPLRTTVTRSLVVPLSGGCRTDVPLIITVTARDGALETASRQLSMMVSADDVTPPRIVPVFFLPHGGDAVLEMAGEYAVGDSIHVIFNASDNRALAALVWEALPSGVRDSVVWGPDVPHRMKLPVRESWGTGPIQVRIYARDAAGLTSNVYTSAPNAVNVYPTILVTTGQQQGGMSRLSVIEMR